MLGGYIVSWCRWIAGPGREDLQPHWFSSQDVFSVPENVRHAQNRIIKLCAAADDNVRDTEWMGWTFAVALVGNKSFWDFDSLDCIFDVKFTRKEKPCTIGLAWNIENQNKNNYSLWGPDAMLAFYETHLR